MRILQLIDTLNPGGAERMVVNYANSLSKFGHEAFVMTTREEGDFKILLNPDVIYKFINKQRAIDRKALSRINKFIKNNKIDIIHAHGTSWFFAVLCKLSGCKAKLIWHNHYGATSSMPIYKRKILRLFSRYFDGIISVNGELKDWADKYLKCKNSIDLVNFVIIGESRISTKKNRLNVVCLANLRPVKNHIFLLEACDMLAQELQFDLHLIGKDYNDEYSIKLKREFDKRSYVKYHGSLVDTSSVLHKMMVGVLSSSSEGMPMVILEYGAAGLPVVSTDVGACKTILEGHSNIVDPGDLNGMAVGIKDYLNNSKKAQNDSNELRKLIYKRYSANVVIPTYLNFCISL